MKKKDFDVMKACAASAKDFIDTVLFCMKEDGFEPVEGHQGRVMDFEYNGNVDDLDVNELTASIAENVIDDRFSVRVSTYDEEKAGEEYKNLFCVEVWLNE